MSQLSADRECRFTYLAPSFQAQAPYQGTWYKTEKEARGAATDAFCERREMVARALIIKAVFRKDGTLDYRVVGKVLDA